MAESLGFIGLGQMGLPMAGNLLASGFSLVVHNRTPAKAAPLVEKGAKLADSPAGAAAAGGIVVSIVSDDRALEAIVTDEFLAAMKPGGLHISMSTVSPATNQRLAERHARAGSSLLGAPVFGRPEAAAARKLWICASGSAADKARAKGVFDAIGQRVFDFGEDVGAGNVVKLAGNFLLTAAIEAMAEASALAEKNGIPRAAMLNMFTTTLFNCPIYVNYSKRIIAADFEKAGFNIPLILKDMHLVQQTATAAQVPMPTLNLLCDRYLKMLANGEGKLDASAIALGAARDAGLQW
ncbi:MAG TPA: NAD(P)-dependent oxidoreductase [Tepidisphaeraceae bacterium]|jgi:3-hydroxyisobutyrate dehydrogenase-like beta-hydroxyacid dehydrogenase|nr:NAD(P)-dependent oxidoreductase [Tepidisphaeraceae bacterium]